MFVLWFQLSIGYRLQSLSNELFLFDSFDYHAFQCIIYFAIVNINKSADRGRLYSFNAITMYAETFNQGNISTRTIEMSAHMY